MIDCKSQNTENEQQKYLCITSEQLTEQWKKGELPVGEEYWVILTDEWYLRNPVEPVRAFYSCDCEFEGYFDDDIKQVLAPVPSYEEWIGVKQQRDLENKLRHDSDNKNWQLRTKNAQLKELLKECTPYVDRYVAFSVVQGNKEREVKSKELLDKIDEALK